MFTSSIYAFHLGEIKNNYSEPYKTCKVGNKQIIVLHVKNEHWRQNRIKWDHKLNRRYLFLFSQCLFVAFNKFENLLTGPTWRPVTTPAQFWLYILKCSWKKYAVGNRVNRVILLLKDIVKLPTGCLRLNVKNYLVSIPGDKTGGKS